MPFPIKYEEKVQSRSQLTSGILNLYETGSFFILETRKKNFQTEKVEYNNYSTAKRNNVVSEYVIGTYDSVSNTNLDPNHPRYQ